MRTGTVIVTGCTGGLGQATCRLLAAQGFDIIGQYRSREDAAMALQEDVARVGGRASMVCADLADPAGVDRLVSEVEDILSQPGTSSLMGLVNNAAKLLGPAFGSATARQFDDFMSLNIRAPFFLAQQLSTLMCAGGSIVNVSSVATRFSSPGDIVYAMSKAALEALTYHAAEVLAEKGVRINTVMPGFTDNGHPAFGEPRMREFMSSFAALGGVAQPEEIAASICFLISDASSRTTGSILDASGGSALGRRPAEGSISNLLD
ncbi:SDR family oxidoreductase [Brevibacterium picturae]|uniref:SDR family oxidoreductase n=1 Tax=Brevibacterium picturae TaxID=260553 RepID=A0ABP4LYN7_9MICO